MENHAKVTIHHSRAVGMLMIKLCKDLLDRAVLHDYSKLCPPEYEVWCRRDCATYGSSEYLEGLKECQIALEHHYAVNAHHPEHYELGVNGMNLCDLLEMLCDWGAQSNCCGLDTDEMLLQQQLRFGLTDQLVSILRNTLDYLKETNT